MIAVRWCEGTPAGVPIRAGEIQVWSIGTHSVPSAHSVPWAHSVSSGHVSRAIVAGALDAPPDQVRLARDSCGRPFVAGHESIGLSVAHRDGVSLLAIDPLGRIGLDVESRAAAAGIAELATTFLPAARVAALRMSGVPPDSQRWVELWTELEACSKLAGTGLGDLDPDVAARLLAEPHDLVRFGAGPDHVAALVHPPSVRRIRFLVLPAADLRPAGAPLVAAAGA